MEGDGVAHRGAILITGTSTGIGHATAILLDRAGYTVFAGVRKVQDAARLRSEASALLCPVILDITDQAQIDTALAFIRERLGSEGGLQGLVNNAGRGEAGPMELIAIDRLRYQLEVNLVGHVALIQACLPLIRRGHGRIINIGSAAADFPMPFLGAYAASKSAMFITSTVLRRELRWWGIPVSIIQTGFVHSAIWNDAEAPEPPANLTATLKGAVIHRFCETFRKGDDPATRLRTSFNEVVAQRQSELAGRVFEINTEQAVNDLMPLARHYLESEVFQRVSHASRVHAESSQFEFRNPQTSSPGLWSELRFRLRRPLGILTGTIDKLLITTAANGKAIDVEVIDFKTNRFSRQAVPQKNRARSAAVTTGGRGELKIGNRSQPAQGLFDFESVPENVADQGSGHESSTDSEVSFTAQAEMLAHDYQLQMQAYALALRELLPESVRVNSLRATLHFIEPNLEVALASDLLEHDNCVRMIDDAMLQIATLDGTLDAESFPPVPATHCRMCNFLELCPAGREWLRGAKR